MIELIVLLVLVVIGLTVGGLLRASGSSKLVTRYDGSTHEMRAELDALANAILDCEQQMVQHGYAGSRSLLRKASEAYMQLDDAYQTARSVTALDVLVPQARQARKWLDEASTLVSYYGHAPSRRLMVNQTCDSREAMYYRERR